MRTIIVAFAAVLVSNLASAEEASTNSFYHRFNQKMEEYEVKIRSSVFNKQNFGDPAAFQFTSPRDGGSDYWAVDIGVTANLAKMLFPNAVDRLYLGPSIEYHKHTLTNKPQDNLQIGLNTLYQFGSPRSFPYAHIFQLLPTYKNDRRGNGEGLLVRLDYLPMIPDLAISTHHGSAWFRYEWQPILGLQLETADEVGTPKRKGDESRFKASVQASLYPFAGEQYLGQRFQIYIGYTYWHSFERSGGFKDLRSDNRLFKVGANFYLDAKKHVAIGVDYTDGANIEAGKPKQETLSAAFKLIY